MNKQQNMVQLLFKRIDNCKIPASLLGKRHELLTTDNRSYNVYRTWEKVDFLSRSSELSREENRRNEKSIQVRD
jgi:hypothetical protein